MRYECKYKAVGFISRIYSHPQNKQRVREAVKERKFALLHMPSRDRVYTCIVWAAMLSP